MKNLLFTTLLTVFGVYTTWSQQQFTKEKEKFVKEWQRLVSDPEAHDFCKDELPDLVVKSKKLTDGQFGKIVDNCNSLLGKQVPLFPEVYKYMVSAVCQVENNFPSVFCNEWYSILTGYQGKDEDKFIKFLDFSYDLFRYKSLYKQDDYRWSFDNGSLTWITDKKLSIECKEGNFVCRVYAGKRTVTDSVVIYRTSGVFDVFGNKWEGRNGTVTWQKVKFDKDKTFARIKSAYRCDLKSAMVRVDTVELTTPYFKNPILGKLMDKTILEMNEGESSPQFNSFEKRLKIPNLRENLDYDGGFTLEGADFIGKGTPEKPAKIIIKRNDKRLFEIASVDFEMDPSKILSRKASAKMFYSNGDSLYIKEAFIFLDEGKKELSMTAGKKGYDFVPFEDSYFKVFVKAPVLVWKMNTANLYYTFEIGTSQEQKAAEIISYDFFDQPEYQKFKGIGATHPFSLIAKKCEDTKKYDLSEGDIANLMNKTIQQAKPELVDMEAAGFLTKNTVTNLIHVENKLLNYAKAGAGLKDFDYIKITSDLRPMKLGYSPQEIAQDAYLRDLDNMYKQATARRQRIIAYTFIDLDKNSMRINEVDEVNLSPIQIAVIFPDSSNVFMEKNRKLRFTGWFVAGKFEVHSNLSTFDYDEFKVNVPSSDQAFFRVKPLRKEDGNDNIPMVSSLSFFNGEILIDTKETKNGKSTKNADYPIMKSVGETRVFYSDKSIVNGAYDSTRFYYAVKPFTMDSLDNFAERTLLLSGELNSGGIFPKITENLKIMNDYSFGFSTVAPTGGYSFYGTDTKYENKIVLSNNGLQGSGTINFLNSTSVSNKLTFLPDSTIGLAKFTNKEVKEGVTYPSVTSDQAHISYQPKKQQMKASSFREIPLVMFNGETSMQGSVIFDKTGMIGNGTLTFKEAIMKSQLYKFTHDDIFSDNCSFSLMNRYSKFGEDPLAIQSEGLNGHVSFKERRGIFNSNGTKVIKFPANNYYCQMDKFIWMMDGESIDFEKNKGGETTFEAGVGVVNDNFFCTDEKQDSLRFKSLGAKYDLKQQTIFCSKVEFVQSGDARIYPDSMKVNIRKGGVMDPLSNAVIVANYISKFHKFVNANIQIRSRKVFDGTAKYSYYDRDSSLTLVPMSAIKSNGKATAAIGDIKEADKFKLSKEFDYFGKISVVSYMPGIILEGQTRINHSCKYDKSWMSFKDTILAKNIQIPIQAESVNAAGERLANGFLWRDSEKSDSLRIYPSFLSKQEGGLDLPLYNSYGYIQFNQAANEYQIGNKKRLNKEDSLSNLLTLHLKTCLVTGYGDMTLGLNLGELKAQLYGKIEYNQNDNKTTINANAKIDMQVDKNVIEGLANKLKIVEEFPELDINNAALDLKNTLAHWGGHNKMEDVFKDFDEEKLKKMPSTLENSFILTGLKLESYGNMKGGAPGKKIDKGIISRESRIGVLSMNGIAVLKEVDFQLFCNQTFSKESGQGFYWHIKLPNDRYYFINYAMDKKDGTLLFFSNDATFNKTITDIKPDKRKLKNFTYDVGEESLGKNLMSKFNGYFLYR